MSSDKAQGKDVSSRDDMGADALPAPAGYKRTAVGLIPQDWQIKPLGLLGEALIGLTYRPSDVREDGILVLRSSNIQNDALAFHDNVFVDTDIPERLKVRPGDVLICVRNGSRDLIGKSTLLDERVVGMTFGAFMAVFRSPIGKAVSHLFESEILKRQINEHLGATINQITNKSLNSFIVPVPTMVAEQRAIAEALSDVDDLLGALEALIAKKWAIKQAAMQQLLTGKTRLPGFSGEWETKRLGAFTSIRNQKVLPSEVDPSLPCVELEHIGQADGRLLAHSMAADSTSSKYRFLAGDVLFGRLRSYLRKYWLAEFDGICSTEIWPLAVDPTQAHRGFLCGIVQADRFIESASVSYGTHMPRADWAVMRNLDVLLPCVAEQAAIAAVLSDMDAEIVALEDRRDKTRAIKRGMMQQLLTGRIRLVRPDASGSATKQASSRNANVHFVRSVLAAEIIDRLHEQPTFGHVKFAKMMFLVERLCDVDTGSTYHRKAAGPYDNRALRSIDSQLRAQHWFDARKEGDRYRYVPMKKRGGHREYFDRYFTGVREKFDHILDTFKGLDTEQCEIVATLLAAWGDLLRDRGTVDDQLIVNEVLNNWHEAKRRISEDRWLKALGWMRKQGFVPSSAQASTSA